MDKNIVYIVIIWGELKVIHANQSNQTLIINIIKFQMLWEVLFLIEKIINLSLKIFLLIVLSRKVFLWQFYVNYAN
jgi:hypothetical protein